ncbi:hypothetical protein MNB_SV-5-658 [hydrothermal vent metagenome]|uniref:Carboxypeptidase regulatory-like domain-containing protein n=1 Tax=hydrothermal vent metagenome TaxID=652676 RepID=A0A1W1ED95_9ZZZZ
MSKTILHMALFVISLFLLSGCVSNNLNPSGEKRGTSNPWSQQTSDEEGENIDISDLDGNITESELGMVEMSDNNIVKRIPFPVAEYRGYSGVGKGTIKGSIYVKNSYGEKILGKGTRLYLNPATSYSNQWYQESYIGGAKMEKADSRLFNYLRFTASDSNGAYAFYGVPSGSYYLIGTVQCGTECGYDTPKSVRIATKVSVSGNNVVEQDLGRFVD